VGGRVRLAVAGAGLIGRRHIEEIDASGSAQLAAIVDPFPAARQVADTFGVPLYASLAELFTADRPDGVVLATPNQLHVDGGLECVAAGVPVLVEKPIGDTVEGATRLVEAAEASGVAVLTGHHRNYSPIMARARELVQSGVLGSIVAVVGTALFYKPDDYFDAGGGWRRQPGGGPILLNLIHEVNNLQSLVGDVVRVQATTSNATRGFPVEDTAAMVFTFANGALGTFLLSDTAASPRSWEQTSQENLSYAAYPDEDCYHLAGTRGSLSVPTMRLKAYEGDRSWWRPLESSTVELERSDPLANQIEHFAAVVRGEAEPICSGRDGVKTLLVVDAVVESARTGQPVDLRY
jgi:predicted dehydrogenase